MQEHLPPLRSADYSDQKRSVIQKVLMHVSICACSLLEGHYTEPPLSEPQTIPRYNDSETDDSIHIQHTNNTVSFSLNKHHVSIGSWVIAGKRYYMDTLVNGKTIGEQIESIDFTEQGDLVCVFENKLGNIRIPKESIDHIIHASEEQIIGVVHVPDIQYKITLSDTSATLYSCVQIGQSATDVLPNFLQQFCKTDPLPELEGNCTLMLTVQSKFLAMDTE